MKRLAGYLPLLRAVGVLSAVGILVTSVTYAQLKSQPAVLTGNSIKSASADLRIGTSASTFDNSRTGFTFADVFPGGPAMPADGNTFYLKNYGSTQMSLKLSIGTTPTVTNSLDLSKVYVVLTRVDNGTEQKLGVEELVAAHTAGGKVITDTITHGVAVQYKLRATMDADAFEGTGATVTGIDLVFSGAPVL